MGGNSFGKSLILTTFGESHGTAVGGVLDGFPAKIRIDQSFVQEALNRRKPGEGSFSSPRREADRVEFLSGIFEEMSTGAPIAFLVYNTDHRPGDYDHLRDIYRPSHADYTWESKFGIRDHRGGGRTSARETVARVVGGALAALYLKSKKITVEAHVAMVAHFPFPEKADEAFAYLEQLRTEGDTTGGIVACSVTGVPAGIGEPVFDKLQADLAKAMLSINAAKGFEYGSGFAAASMRGSVHNDPFLIKEGKVTTATNHSGGIQGGISNGNEIFFRVAFKPVSSLKRDQVTIDRSGTVVTLPGKGRHDACIVFRAAPVVEAMAALTVADHLLR
jgi:chorismate synthase